MIVRRVVIHFVCLMCLSSLFLVSSAAGAMSIDSFTPVSGTNTGQVTITITGSGFQSEIIDQILLNQSITNRIPCSSFSIHSDTQLSVTFDIAQQEVGSYQIWMKTRSLATYVSQVPFKIMYPVSPKVTAITPDSGQVNEQPFSCTVTGSGFTFDSLVELVHESGTIYQASTVVHNGDSLSASFSVDTEHGGVYRVQVVNGDGQVSSELVYFTTIGIPPVVTGVQPEIGLTSDENIEVTVTGSGFLDGCVLHLRDPESGEIVVSSGPTGVNEGGNSVQGIFDLSGLSVGDYVVRVVNPDGQSNAEDVVFSISHPVPVVISVNPDSGLTSEESVEVTITGSGFLDGCVLHLRDPESGEIVVTSGPTGVNEGGTSVCGSFDLSGVTVGDYIVRVVNPDGQSNVEDVVFSINHPAPVVISVNPDSGLTSEESVEVTVTGSGFLDGCVLHLRDPDSGEIVVTSGPTVVNEEGNSVCGSFDLSGVTVGDYIVRVVNPDGQSNVEDVVFSINHPAPVVISVNPDSGLTSEESVEVTVTGSGFLDGCVLHLRDPESGEIVVTSGPTVVTEEGNSVCGSFDLSGVTAGNYVVRVVNPDDQSNVEDVVFSISHPVPVVISVNPDSGLTSEENVEVTVTGSGFLDGCVLHLRDPESGEIVVTTGPTVITEEGTSVRGSFDLTGVIAGEYNLYVENPNGVLSFDTVIFRIQSPPNPSYEITIHSGNGGKTEPHGIVIVSESSDLSIRSTPCAGYTVKNVYLDSIPQGPVPVFTLPDIRSKHYVFVEFSQIIPVPTPIPTIIPVPPPTPDPVFYSISVSSDYGSMITPNGTITVPKGSLIPFQMTTLTDFHIVHLLVDTIPVHVHNSWILNPVTRDHEIHLVSDRNISPNWANFSLFLPEGNETRNISIISESYPDATWEFWDFGDGVTAYGNPINHTYQSAGNFSITRKVVFQNSSSQCRREIRI
ncbi:hypothetical protein KSK55_14635 [Methanospirillum purgamenti]|uniref:PKD domain-containing protein n=1 Tax=Methanospirillum hungatei TaxID=2203 RepID=A0A8F5VP89_METHU|nr:PKD domain-containing protein [Methanospirillum hungatei]QXO94533.1 hypothetical protein KSK55_14635 [Methanospirillum hungatei]